MRIISKKRLRKYWEKHAQAKEPLLFWYDVAKKAQWQTIADAKQDFAHADAVGACTVFNIGGNSFRLITKIKYRYQIIYIRVVLTHAEYDKGDWKNDCGS